MSNCNTGDQQSQRQINVKECFASWVVIHAVQGGKILFVNSAGRKVGLDAESLWQISILRSAGRYSRAPSLTTVEKLGPRNLRIVGFDAAWVSGASPLQASDRY